MNTKNPTQNDPVSRFVYHIQNSLDLCSRITQHLEDHMGVNPDDVNWGHVGSAEHVCELLEGIVEFFDPT